MDWHLSLIHIYPIDAGDIAWNQTASLNKKIVVKKTVQHLILHQKLAEAIGVRHPHNRMHNRTDTIPVSYTHLFFWKDPAL